MKKLLLCLAAALLPPSVSMAGQEQADVMTVVRQWTQVFDQGDASKALSACAESTAIIDDIAPYVWQGPGACRRWLKAFAGFLKDNHIGESHHTLLEPWQVTVAADHAYVVVPIDFAFTMNGKAEKALGSILTAVLRKSGGGWRITAWSLAAK